MLVHGISMSSNDSPLKLRLPHSEVSGYTSTKPISATDPGSVASKLYSLN